MTEVLMKWTLNASFIPPVMTELLFHSTYNQSSIFMSDMRAKQGAYQTARMHMRRLISAYVVCWII